MARPRRRRGLSLVLVVQRLSRPTVGVLARDSKERLQLASVRARALQGLRRAGLAERLRIEPTVDAAVKRGSEFSDL